MRLCTPLNNVTTYSCADLDSVCDFPAVRLAENWAYLLGLPVRDLLIDSDGYICSPAAAGWYQWGKVHFQGTRLIARVDRDLAGRVPYFHEACIGESAWTFIYDFPPVITRRTVKGA